MNMFNKDGRQKYEENRLANLPKLAIDNEENLRVLGLESLNYWNSQPYTDYGAPRPIIKWAPKDIDNPTEPWQVVFNSLYPALRPLFVSVLSGGHENARQLYSNEGHSHQECSNLVDALLQNGKTYKIENGQFILYRHNSNGTYDRFALANLSTDIKDMYTVAKEKVATRNYGQNLGAAGQRGKR